MHLGDIPGFRPEDVDAHSAAAAAALAQTPRAYLFHGYTSVIDLAGSSQSIGAWNAQDLRPHAYYCGAAPVQDGYPTNYVPAPQRYVLVPGYLHDPAGGAALPDGAEAAAHTPEAVVARIVGDGAICVKTYYERGFGQARNQLPVPSAALIQELVAAAHARELPVSAARQCRGGAGVRRRRGCRRIRARHVALERCRRDRSTARSPTKSGRPWPRASHCSRRYKC